MNKLTDADFLAFIKSHKPLLSKIAFDLKLERKDVENELYFSFLKVQKTFDKTESSNFNSYFHSITKHYAQDKFKSIDFKSSKITDSFDFLDNEQKENNADKVLFKSSHFDSDTPENTLEAKQQLNHILALRGAQSAKRSDFLRKQNPHATAKEIGYMRKLLNEFLDEISNLDDEEEVTL